MSGNKKVWCAIRATYPFPNKNDKVNVWEIMTQDRKENGCVIIRDASKTIVVYLMIKISEKDIENAIFATDILRTYSGKIKQDRLKLMKEAGLRVLGKTIPDETVSYEVLQKFTITSDVFLEEPIILFCASLDETKSLIDGYDHLCSDIDINQDGMFATYKYLSRALYVTIKAHRISPIIISPHRLK